MKIICNTEVDYYALPEGERAELISGKLYDMASKGSFIRKYREEYSGL